MIHGKHFQNCILLHKSTLGTSFTLSRPRFLQLLERWVISEVAEFGMMTEEMDRKDVRALMPYCQRRF